MFTRLLPCLLVSLLLTSPLLSQGKKAKSKGSKFEAAPLVATPVRHEDRLYKTTPQGDLKLHWSFPKDWKASDKRPAAIFFFGGGWKSGSYVQFTALCDYLATRGMVAASADYRIESIHHTTPDKCVEDAKSAIRWTRQHAAELGIDPNRIASGGGSAGGHLAACTALIPTLDAAGEDSSISSKPAALILFNPALNIGTLFRERAASNTNFTQQQADAITPNSFLSKDTPPAILFFGTADKLIAGAQEYVQKARPLALRAELWTASDMPHGFFNRSPWREVTAQQTDTFLQSLGWISGPATLTLPDKSPSLNAPAP